MHAADFRPLHSRKPMQLCKTIIFQFFKKTSFSLKYLQGSQCNREAHGFPLSSAVVTQIFGGLFLPPYLPRGRRGWWAEEEVTWMRRRQENEPASCRGNTGRDDGDEDGAGRLMVWTQSVLTRRGAGPEMGLRSKPAEPFTLYQDLL